MARVEQAITYQISLSGDEMTTVCRGLHALGADTQAVGLLASFADPVPAAQLLTEVVHVPAKTQTPPAPPATLSEAAAREAAEIAERYPDAVASRIAEE